MLMNVLLKIPLLQSLIYFPWVTHKKALPKFLTLWCLASLPVLFAALLSKVAASDTVSGAYVAAKIIESLSVSEQFVYSASFLTPLLYIAYEKFRARDEGESIADYVKNPQLFSGYWLVVVLSLIVMLATAVAFGAMKSSLEAFKETVLHGVLQSWSLWIYAFALYCWYLTLLDEKHTPDFNASKAEQEQQATKGLAARVRRMRP